jgi:hypothetical protein
MKIVYNRESLENKVVNFFDGKNFSGVKINKFNYIDVGDGNYVLDKYLNVYNDYKKIKKLDNASIINILYKMEKGLN